MPSRRRAALWSTADDMLAMLEAFAHPPPGMEVALPLALRARFTAGPRLTLGLGWHRSALPRSGAMVAWHNGRTAGCRSHVALVPGSGAAVVALGNSARSVDRVARGLLQALA